MSMSGAFKSFAIASIFGVSLSAGVTAASTFPAAALVVEEGVSVQSTRGFDIINYSSSTFTLDSVFFSDVADEAPPVGTVLGPHETLHFEVGVKGWPWLGEVRAYFNAGDSKLKIVMTVDHFHTRYVSVTSPLVTHVKQNGNVRLYDKGHASAD